MSIRSTLASVTALVLVAAAGHAQSSLADQVVSTLTAEGYTYIEVKTGPTQTKVEAIRGDRQLEAIYDTATGVILKQQVNPVTADDDTTPGVKVDVRDRDFIDGAGRMHEDDPDDNNHGLGLNDDDDKVPGPRTENSNAGDDHHGRGRGMDDDEGDDDHQGRDRGMDNDDDDNDDHEAGDDDDDNDRSGRGRGRGGDNN